MLARCAVTARGLNRLVCADNFYGYVFPSFCFRSAIHTGSTGSSPSFSPFHKSAGNTAPFTETRRRFLSIDDKNDREYINARCITIKPPVQPAGDDASTLDGGLRIETTEKVSKVQLCRDNGIQPRDLRSLDTDMVLVNSIDSSR